MAGIVIGVLLAVVLIAGAVFYFVRVQGGVLPGRRANDDRVDFTNHDAMSYGDNANNNSGTDFQVNIR